MQKGNNESVRFELSFRSKPENIGLIEPYVRNIQKKYRLDEETCFNILLVLTEAVNNSILHGNQSDPSKFVTVKLNSSKQTIAFTIGDEGRGFDPASIPDPTGPDRIDCPNGRGVFLMRELSDKIHFRDDGRCVEIHFSHK